MFVATLSFVDGTIRKVQNIEGWELAGESFIQFNKVGNTTVLYPVAEISSVVIEPTTETVPATKVVPLQKLWPEDFGTGKDKDPYP